ncbi:MAG TPA: BamA/TamA family outer membrane protein, partial [Gemmatimonas sp.]|nr:BamA/TamA family outer membrane protein [Gemmatimonas sp.]
MSNASAPLTLLTVLGLSVGSAMLSPLVAQTAAESRDSTVARRRVQILPALGSAPETGLQYGITSFAVFEPAPMAHARPATAMAYAIRTAKSQTRIGIEGEHWSSNNDRRLAGTLVWQEYPLPFYGIGDDTPETAKEIFSPRGIEATATVQQRLVRSLYGLSTLRVIDQTITPDSTGALRNSGLTGVNGGRVVELTLGALDDTRDNLFAPDRGHLVQLTYGRGLDAVGSGFNYGRVRLDARAYRSVGGRGVIAAQVVGVGMDGTPPFDGLAMVGGGDIMRGYARGR